MKRTSILAMVILCRHGVRRRRDRRGQALRRRPHVRRPAPGHAAVGGAECCSHRAGHGTDAVGRRRQSSGACRCRIRHVALDGPHRRHRRRPGSRGTDVASRPVGSVRQLPADRTAGDRGSIPGADVPGPQGAGRSPDAVRGRRRGRAGLGNTPGGYETQVPSKASTDKPAFEPVFGGTSTPVAACGGRGFAGGLRSGAFHSAGQGAVPQAAGGV